MSEVIEYRRCVLLECLDNRAEVYVAQGHYFLIPFIHLSQCLCRVDFLIEYAAQFHRKMIGVFQYRIMPEQDVGAMTLYISLFVLSHHQGVLASGKYFGLCPINLIGEIVVIFILHYKSV